jgi:NADPH:quinone reductase-like Zn-dependent oxidoreductase
VAVCSGRNAQHAKEHGAHLVVDYTSERFADAYGKKAADEDRFDIVYDCATNSGGGEDYKAQALECLKQQSGQYVAINGALGMWLRLFSGWGQKRREHLFLTDMNTSDLEYIASLVDGAGAPPLCPVKVVICRALPFSAAGVGEGFALLQSRRAVGKIVFDIAASATAGGNRT